MMSSKVQERIDALMRAGVRRDLAEEIARNEEEKRVPTHVASSRDNVTRRQQRSKRAARLAFLRSIGAR